MVAMGCHGIAIMADDKCGKKNREGARPRALGKAVQPVGRGTALGLDLARPCEPRIARTRSLPGRGGTLSFCHQSEVQMKSCNLPEKGQSSAF